MSLCIQAGACMLTWCTFSGGIRCDVYSAHLRDKGFKNLYTLEGGVQNYLRQEGHSMWDGSLFVFDGRMAVPSGQAQPQHCTNNCSLCYACTLICYMFLISVCLINNGRLVKCFARHSCTPSVPFGSGALVMIGVSLSSVAPA